MANELAKQDAKALPLRIDNQLTPAYEQLLANLRNGYPDAIAIEMAGIKYSTAFNHKLNDEDFRRQWDEAFEAGTDRVFVAEATRRAVQGVQRPYIYKGKPVVDAQGKAVMITEFSDRLLELMLTARRPRVYGKKVEVSGPNGEPLRILLTPDEMAL